VKSAGHRTATIVTVLTLILAPVARHQHWVWQVVGKQTTTTTVACAPGAACPQKQLKVQWVHLDTTTVSERSTKRR
jgi:hypothetical protein